MTRNPAPRKTRLGKHDWIMAAFRALTAGGPQAIKAEVIARALGVSKGSFYWHFRDVADLRAAMIRHWRQAATETVIATLDDTGTPAPERLRALVDIAASERSSEYGGALAEAAIRDWARYDGAVGGALQAVDRQRLDYVAGLFADCGFGPVAARLRARLLYGALIGLDLLAPADGGAKGGTDGEADTATALRLLLERLLADAPEG